MKIPRPRSRPWVLGVAAVVVTVPLLLAAGCTETAISGEARQVLPRPAAPFAQPSPFAQPAPSPSARPASGYCRIRVTSGGSSITSQNVSTQMRTVNGRSTFSCGSSPMITIAAVESSGVTFTANRTSVTILPGTSDTVGSARIDVQSADSGAAKFQVTPG